MENTGLPTKLSRAKHSDTQKISQGSLTVRATQERIKDGRTDTTSSPTSQKDTKDPTQSAHYRLWSPGFLVVSLVPEEQDPATQTKAPALAMATAGMNLDIIASLQVDDLQKLIQSLQGLAASR